MASIRAIYASEPKDFMDQGERYTTAFKKSEVVGPVWLGENNLDGDGQADRIHHGGADKALLMYGSQHYEQWHRDFPQLPNRFGLFGENILVDGLMESNVCIGDVYAVGDTLVQVSQPRIPCWKISRAWGIDGLTEAVRNTGFTGWYLRVLREGRISSGMPVVLRERNWPMLQVTRANALLHNAHGTGMEEVQSFLTCEALADAFRSNLQNRVARDDLK